MSILLGILGRGITLDTSELIWNWFELMFAKTEQANDSKFQQILQIADLARKGKLQSAQQSLRLYLFDNPSCILGRLAAGALCINQNRITEAIEQLKSVYMRSPSNTMALYALGYCNERLGMEAEAIEFYQDCLKFKNFLHLPRQRLAAICFKNEYERLRGEYPDDIPSLVILGHLYIASQQYEKAIDTFNTAILIHPDNFLGRDDEVESLVNQNQMHDALDLVDTKLQSDPENLELLVRRGDILAMLASTSEAAESYQQAITICPDLLEPTIKLGTQYLQMQKDEMAARQFNLAFEINDRVVDSYMGLATAQKLSGKTSDALATLSLASSIQPNSTILFAQTACLQCHCGLLSHTDYASANEPSPRMAAAIEAHQHHLSVDSSNPDLYYRLGLLLYSLGNFDDSSKAFYTAININPTFDRSRSKLSICLYELGKKDKALDLLQSSETLDSKTLDLHYKIALLYCDKVKFASSLMNLDNIMQSTFTRTSATHNVSVVLQNLGLLDRAVTTWENLVDTANSANDNLSGPPGHDLAY